MDIWTQIENDHKELKALGEDVKASVGGDGPASRDNQFDLFDVKLRRHLAAVEDVVLPPLEKKPDTSATVHEIEQHHKSMRRDLNALDRTNKQDETWTKEFDVVLGQLDKLCKRHEALIAKAQPLVNAEEGDTLGERYTKAKLKRIPGGSWDWNKIGIGAGAALGLAAAGAAVAAGKRYKDKKDEEGEDPFWKRRTSDADDFELRLQTDENVRLIASDKVDGTKVVDRDGTNVGKVMNFMVDKYTGRVAYAVLQFGGTFGVGAHYFPLPWPVLDYDESVDAYRLTIEKSVLEQAPKFEKDKSPEFDTEYRKTVIAYYR
ncbi:MAG: PRC-barrel domain-containing protein, partial [Pacificimonas sp.]